MNILIFNIIKYFRLAASKLDAAALVPYTTFAALIIMFACPMSPIVKIVYGDTIFYKCAPAEGKIKIKILYNMMSGYNEKQRMSIINKMKKRSYKYAGSSYALLKYNSAGYLINSKTNTQYCFIANKKYSIKIGAVVANKNANGQCGAWSTHFIEIKLYNDKTKTVVLKKTILSSCGSNTAISKILVNVFDSPAKIRIENERLDGLPFLKQNDSLIKNIAISYYPVGISVNGSNHIWITDRHYLIKLNNKGKILLKRKFNGYLGPIITYCVNRICNIWVGESPKYQRWIQKEKSYGPGKIIELNSLGKIIKTINIKSDPTAMTIDNLGNIWVANGLEITEILK